MKFLLPISCFLICVTAVPFPDPDWLGNVRDTVDSSVNQVKQGYDEFKNDFNDGFNKIRGTTWSENSENEVESTFKNIRVDADKASDLFWGGRCVLDSNCAYFTIFNYTFQVSKCSSSTGIGIGSCVPRLWTWVTILCVGISLLICVCGTVCCCRRS